jgi:2-dehydro-3-deoxyphosphooctonate aldolase (KDO 8-P synthase)
MIQFFELCSKPIQLNSLPLYTSPVHIQPNLIVAPAHMLLLAGPCVIESAQLCLDVAATMKGICAELGIQYVFKASFDKANRTSLGSFRGDGLHTGLKILEQVKQQVQVPVVTDIHLPGTGK